MRGSRSFGRRSDGFEHGRQTLADADAERDDPVLAAASAQLYVEALHAAGLPAGIVNLVQGDRAVGQALLAHAGIHAAVFAGSREHAREVRRATSCC